MSLLKRLSSKDQQPKNLLRRLIESLAEDEEVAQQMRQQVLAAAADLEIDLTNEDHRRIEDDLAAFLLDPVLVHTPRVEPPQALTSESSFEDILRHVYGVFQVWALSNWTWPDFEPGPSYDFITHDFVNVGPTLTEPLNEIIDSLTFADGTPLNLSKPEIRRLRNEVFAELFGLGPLVPLLQDDTITEIFILPSRQTIVTRRGIQTDLGIIFDSDEYLQRIIDRMFAPLGLRVDQDHPYIHVRMPDGSRVTVVLPTLSLDGPTLTIRKFDPRPVSTDDLLSFKAITQQALDFLQAAVLSGVNILITGGPFTGRTTLLNGLASVIPATHRIVAVERRTELRLSNPLTTRLVAAPPQVAPDLTAGDMYRAAADLAPDFVLIGDSDGQGIIEMLRLMNRLRGVLVVTDGYSPEYALSAIHDWAQAEANRPTDDHLRVMISHAVDVVVHLEQLPDGRRAVSRIAEVGEEWESGAPTLTDLFRYERTGDDQGPVPGELKATADAPSQPLWQRLRSAGFTL